jgi:hypothetical protein
MNNNVPAEVRPLVTGLKNVTEDLAVMAKTSQNRLNVRPGDPAAATVSSTNSLVTYLNSRDTASRIIKYVKRAL